MTDCNSPFMKLIVVTLAVKYRVVVNPDDDKRAEADVANDAEVDVNE